MHCLGNKGMEKKMEAGLRSNMGYMGILFMILKKFYLPEGDDRAWECLRLFGLAWGTFRV